MVSAAVQAPPARQFAVLAGISPLYIGFGMIMGVVQGGLPPVMREAGYAVGTAGWIFALYLPFGLAFLWAAQIDRRRLPLAGHRTGWVIVMQLLASLALGLVALGQGLPVAVLLALGFVVTFAIATMDLALDALAVEMVSPAQRPLAASLKLAALAFGAMIGNGAFVLVYGSFGWAATFGLLALATLVLTLPLLLVGERSGVALVPSELAQSELAQSELAPSAPASLRHMLRDRENRRRLLVLTLVCCVIFPLGGLNRIMLVDLGVPLEVIGWLAGTLGPLAMLAASGLAMPLMLRAGMARAWMAFGVLALIALSLLFWGWHHAAVPPALWGTVLIGGAVGGLYVILAAQILGWSAGRQPATDYAAYYGISRLASTVLTIAAAQLSGLIGWGAFYLTGGALLLAVIAVTRLTLLRSLK